MSAAAESKGSASAGQSTAIAIVKQNGLNIFLAIIALVFIGFAITTHNYLTLFNIKTIVRDAALVGIMGIGLTFVTFVVHEGNSRPVHYHFRHEYVARFWLCHLTHRCRSSGHGFWRITRFTDR